MWITKQTNSPSIMGESKNGKDSARKNEHSGTTITGNAIKQQKTFASEDPVPYLPTNITAGRNNKEFQRHRFCNLPSLPAP